MKTKNEELQKLLMKIGEAVYANQQNQSQSTENKEETVDGEGEQKKDN